MLYLTIFCSFFLNNINIIRAAGLVEDKLFNGTVMHIDRINAECRGKNVPCQGYFRGVKAISTSVFIKNFTLVVKEGGMEKLLITITIDRCRSKENLDTCEEYFKKPNIDMCKAIDPNNYVTNIAPLNFPLVPPIKCPIVKGIYHAYNFTYDLAPFIFFNMDGWYWKTKAEVFSPDKNKLVLCMHTAGYVTNSKSKKH